MDLCYTQLDAYPLTPMVEFIRIARYKVFSTVDLKSAYQQIPIHEDGKPYTAFAGNKRLYHFDRMPFGVTKWCAMFSKDY